MKLVPLGTVAEVIAGQSPEGIYYNTNGEGIPFYQGKKEFGDRFLGAPTTWTTKITKLAQHGDILMSVRAPVGPINFSTQQICIGRGLASIRASELVDKNFLFYFLLHKQPEISGNTGAVFDSINKDQIATIEIPLPSLEKQREIVEKLDSVFAEIELAKTETIRSIQNLSDLTDSKLDEVFTMMEAEYRMVQSGTAIDVRDGTHDSPSYLDSGYPLITSKNLRDGSLDFSKVSFITEEDYQKINRRSKVDVGDLLFAMIGTIGNPVVVMENPFFAIKNVGLFKANPNYDMTFLSYFLRTPRIREKFEREAKGTTQRFLGLGYLRTLDIPNVPIKDQLEAVKKLNQFKNELKKLEQNLAQRLENFSELKNSIMSSIFIVDSEEEAVA
jgi:restriction endonuclease S subunit